MYASNTKSLVTELNDLSERNYKFFSKDFKTITEFVVQLIDIEHKIASYFIGWWLYPALEYRNGKKDLNLLLYSLFHKNFFLFYSILDLTLKGLYGPARSLMRISFESLIVSKFCIACSNEKVLKKWANGETVYFTNSILKNILTPDPKPFREFWDMICDYSHPSIYSSQLRLEAEHIEQEVADSLMMICLLLECNYHLLNSHLITTRDGYMAKYYIPKQDYDIPILRQNAHSIFRKFRKVFNKDYIKFISSYKRKWQIKA